MRLHGSVFQHTRNEARGLKEGAPKAGEREATRRAGKPRRETCPSRARAGTIARAGAKRCCPAASFPHVTRSCWAPSFDPKAQPPWALGRLGKGERAAQVEGLGGTSRGGVSVGCRREDSGSPASKPSARECSSPLPPASLGSPLRRSLRPHVPPPFALGLCLRGGILSAALQTPVTASGLWHDKGLPSQAGDSLRLPRLADRQRRGKSAFPLICSEARGRRGGQGLDRSL